VRIVVIIISGSRKRDRNFVNEFHARCRRIRGRTWGRLFGRVDRRVKREREGTNRWRRGIWEYLGILEVSAEWGESDSTRGDVGERGGERI